ncbi:hypothetical protein OSTOST_15634 [Ostertagia ostertagi]
MFLVLAAALFVMANVAVKAGPWPMPRYLENIYKEFFSSLNRDMNWNRTISSQAYTRIMKGTGTLKYPNIMRLTIQEYPLWNNLTMADKLFYTLLPYGIYRSEIEKLPKGVQYGCNHIHAKGTRVVFMLTLCFFRTTLS